MLGVVKPHMPRKGAYFVPPLGLSHSLLWSTSHAFSQVRPPFPKTAHSRASGFDSVVLMSDFKVRASFFRISKSHVGMGNSIISNHF